MLKAHQLPAFAPNAQPQALRVGQQHLAVVNLRGNARDPAFVLSVQQALGLALPVSACTTLANQRLRLVWVGPDDWFVLGPQGEQAALVAALRLALGDQHAAVTDVSSGYFVVSLAGPSARDLLAQGCPMDFHPKRFSCGPSRYHPFLQGRHHRLANRRCIRFRIVGPTQLYRPFLATGSDRLARVWHHCGVVADGSGHETVTIPGS